MHDLLAEWVSWIVPAIQAVGVAIVVWGVIEAIVALGRRGWQLATRREPNVGLGLGHIRITIGRKMVLALEFFIASDIIQTVVVPTWESLGILAGIVAIRTVVVYFLEYEMRHGASEWDGENAPRP
jgi:uncharacterized membrane protein